MVWIAPSFFSSWLWALISWSYHKHTLRICWSAAKSCPTPLFHGLQHARLPCPPLSPGVCSNHWVSDTIQPAHPLLPASSPALAFPHIRVFFFFFPINQLFASGGQSIRATASASVLPLVQGHHTWKLVQGRQQPCAFIAHAPRFYGESFFLRCCQVSVLDVLPPCVMTSLSAKRGSVFAFSLMPTCEKAILRLGPVFLASLSARLRNSNGSQHSKWQGFPGRSHSIEYACNAEDLAWIPG